MPCSFFPSIFFYSSPTLSCRRLVSAITCTHGVALVETYDAGLKRAARGSLKIQDAKIAKNSQSGHHRTTLSSYIFATKDVSTIGKKLVKQQYLPHMSYCPYNMVNFGPLAAKILSLVWGTPANLNGFRVLAALLHGTLVGAVSQTLRR